MDVSTHERTTGDNNMKYIYTFTMKRGKTRLTDYGKIILFNIPPLIDFLNNLGIQMCELSSMPSSVLAKAKEFHQLLKTEHAVGTEIKCCNSKL